MLCKVCIFKISDYLYEAHIIQPTGDILPVSIILENLFPKIKNEYKILDINLINERYKQVRIFINKQKVKIKSGMYKIDIKDNDFSNK